MQAAAYILSVVKMYLHKKLSKATVLIKCFGVTAVAGCLIMFSESTSKGALSGLTFSLKVLVPSLFPFMALASFVVKSGLSDKIGKPFTFIMRNFFGLNSCFAPILFLSLIGGYPVGARGASSMFKNGVVGEHQAKKFALFAVCAGPGFVINFVGVSLYKSEVLGLIILSSQIISVLITGILLNLIDKKGNEELSEHNCIEKLHTNNFSNAVVESAIDSSKGILNICTFVVLFSGFVQIVTDISDNAIFNNTFCCIFEVCSAVNCLSKNSSVEAVAFAIGFGGLCVHFQIYSVLGKININKFAFFFIRIIQGLITALFTNLGCKIFLGTQAVFSTSTVENTEIYGGSMISGIVLISVAICFLYSLKNCRQKI